MFSAIPIMDYRQYRKMRRLVHSCCNYDSGNCLALDDGEKCVCVQSISYSLLCRWFRAAVLPQDKELEAALFYRANRKRCQWRRDTFPIHTRKTVLKGIQKPYQTQRRTLCQKIESIIT